MAKNNEGNVGNIFRSNKTIWQEYFRLTLAALTSATTVAEWNAVVLVQKAEAVADAALETELKKTF